jgi:diguanylate cyclase (GGDEF)-like protein
MHERVAVVDRDLALRERIGAALAREGFQVVTLPPGRESLARLAKDGPFDVLLSDLSSGEMAGLELLDCARRDFPDTELIALAEPDSLDAALRALRLGAADYLRKPLVDAEVGLAVRRTLLARGLMRENESLRSVIRCHEAARVLSSCLETADVLPLALDILSRVLGRNRAAARLLELSPRTVDGIYLRGLPDDVAAELRHEIERGKIFDPAELERGSPSGSQSLRNALRRRGLDDVDLLALPLRVDGRLIGGVWLFADGRPFSPSDLRRAEVVVKQAELALLNCQRFAHASEKAFVDDVTDLYNSRYLLAAVDREVERSDRSGRELSVLFLDLDRFKLVNDRYGHLVGSSVLRELGGLLRDSIRAVDTVSRYGGDEFTIVLVDTGLEGARLVAERIRRAVHTHPFGGARGLQLDLTLSIGVATFPFHGRNREQLLDIADKAMYLAKALGRNQVCTADELSGPPAGRPPGVRGSGDDRGF